VKFTIDRDKLSSRLAVAGCVRNTAWMGLTVSGDVLRIQTGDSEIYVATDIPVTDAEDGVVLVDRKLLSTCVTTLDAGDVSIGTTKKRLRVQQGSRRRYIQTGDPDLLPIEPKIGNQIDVTFPIRDLLGCMRRVCFALNRESKSFTYSVLSGFYFDADDNKIFTADNVRMAFSSLPGPIQESFLASPLCENALASMAKITDDDVTLRCTPPGWIELRTDGVTMRIASIGGTYPIDSVRNVCSLLDTPSAVVVTAEKDRLEPLLHMATELGKQAMLMLNMNPDDQTVTFRMDVSGAGMDDTLSEVTCTGQESILVGLNPSYFNQAVRAIPGEFVNILAYSDHQPIIVQDDDLTVIQMVMGKVDVAEKYRNLQKEEDDEDDF